MENKQNNFLFDEEAFMKKALDKISTKKLLDEEDEAFENLDINNRVLQILEYNFLRLLAGGSFFFLK